MSEQRAASPDEFPDENPGDKAFGEAAREKQEAVDAGATPPEGGEAPRAGGKAEPA